MTEGKVGESWTRLISIITLGDGSYPPHFMEEESDAQQINAHQAFLSRASTWWGWDLNPRLTLNATGLLYSPGAC